MCEDISKPINKGGAIIEINAAPGIRMHHNPYMGTKRNVAGDIVDKLFKDIPKSIPLVAITGTNGKTTTTRLIGYILSIAGYHVGMTTSSGINMSISILNRLKAKIIIFSNDKNNKVMQNNIKNGGYGVYIDEGNIIIQKGTTLKKLMEIDNIGIAMKGILKYNVENAMVACAAAVGLGVNYATIKKGLSSFYCNQDLKPTTIIIIVDAG